MILRHFPDHTHPEFNIDAPPPDYHWPNMVIHASGEDIHYPEHSGPLSIKTAFGGEEHYHVDAARFAVDDSGYLLLNDGQRYESYIEAGKTVESFCVFFERTFANDILRTLVTPVDLLLDPPVDADETPVTFFDRRYRHDRLVTPLLYAMRRTITMRPVSDLWLDQRLRELLERLLVVHRGISPELQSLSAVRKATRAELYRRLYHARDYIDSSYRDPLTIPEIASVACLSQHHFLRQFKQLFGKTPHQYLIDRRLERCELLLKTTNLPVIEICRSIGFESTGSFGSLFQRRYGLSPENFRRNSSARKF